MSTSINFGINNLVVFWNTVQHKAPIKRMHRPGSFFHACWVQLNFTMKNNKLPVMPCRQSFVNNERTLMCGSSLPALLHLDQKSVRFQSTRNSTVASAVEKNEAPSIVQTASLTGATTSLWPKGGSLIKFDQMFFRLPLFGTSESCLTAKQSVFDTRCGKWQSTNFTVL